MGKPQLEKTEANNRQNSSSTKCNSKQTVDQSSQRPEWLPDGWEVDFRTRKSGANMGHGYKCYIDPTGHKFYSKPEVLRYLETVSSNSCTSKKEKICKSNDVIEKSAVEDSPPGWITEIQTRKDNNGNRKDLDEVEKSSVDDLPPEWITEVKLRKDGIRKDLEYTCKYFWKLQLGFVKMLPKFYIDPVSGYVFRSKKDALRYLKSGDISTCVLKPHKRQIQDDEKITPSSAGKKQKLKQSAMKRQLFLDQEIYDESTLELPDANSSKKGQDVTVSSGMMIARVAPGEPMVKNQSSENVASYTAELKKTSDQDDVQKNFVVDVLENASKKNHSNCSLSKTKKFNVAHRFSRRLAGAEPDQLTNVTDEQTLLVPKRNLRKGKTVLDTDLTNKPFLHLNGVLQAEHSHKMQGEVLLNKSRKLSEGQAGFREQPHPVETNKIEDNKQEKDQYSLSGNSSLPSLKVAPKTTRPYLPSLDNPHKSHGLASEVHVLKEKKLHANGTGKSGLQEIHLKSNRSSNKKEHQIPCRSSKRLAGFEPELMSNPISNGRAPEYKSKKSEGEVNATLQQSEGQPAVELADHASITGERSNKSRNPPETPPITNDQLKKLDDEEVSNDEKSEPQQTFAFHYSWSDPCLEFAIQTLTGALPVEDSVGNGPTRIPETDIFPNNNLVENITGSSGDKISQINSKKSKNRKVLTVPRRLSNRLAGHEPEVLPTERAIDTRKSCNDKPASTVILTDGVSGHLHAREESKLIFHASDRLKTLCGESSNKSENLYDAQTVPNEQLQRLEVENGDTDRSNSEFSSPFGNSWSDPCLEFAIKTLTGALPVDAAAADILPVMTPNVNDPPNKELLERTELKSINEEAHDNPNQSQTKKEFNTVCQPSNQVLDQPKLRTCPTSCGNDPKFATKEFYSDDYKITRNLNGREAQHFEARNAGQIDINALIFEEPSTEKRVLEGESVAEKQQPETIYHDNSERSSCVSFMDSWSDPCLDFAFKTLTGTIPGEEPANSHHHREGGSTLPEFGFSSIPQSDIPSNNDIGEKSKPGKQLSTSSSSLPQEKPNLHGFSGVDPQNHYFQCCNDFQRR